MAQIVTYRDLIVWQRSVELVVAIYSLAELFPTAERYGLTAQMRRAAVSIPSNIAEGRRRGSRKEYRRFMLIAYSLGAELETQIEIAKRLSFGSSEDFNKSESLLAEVMRMLNKVLSILRS